MPQTEHQIGRSDPMLRHIHTTVAILTACASGIKSHLALAVILALDVRLDGVGDEGGD